MKENKRKKVFKSVKMLTIAAMLTAMSVAIGIACKTLLNFSDGLFRITFENLPIIISGILFGPIVGGLVGAASDLISYLLSPQIYAPNLIVTAGAFSVGVVSGVISKYVLKKKNRTQIIVSAASAHIVGSMIIKTIGVFQYFQWMALLRIPLYLMIGSVEILILCLLFRSKSFCRAVEY
jgi:ECF transporter S component (folate family)